MENTSNLTTIKTMNNFLKASDYLSKPMKPKRCSNTFGISRRKDYTSEEKLFFVNLVLEGGNSKASVAKQYDIPESTLRGWCKPKHKDKLEKDANEKKNSNTANVFDTPSPSSSSSSATSGMTVSALYQQYRDSHYDHNLIPNSTPHSIPTLQIPKVENLFYNQHQLRYNNNNNITKSNEILEEYEEQQRQIKENIIKHENEMNLTEERKENEGEEQEEEVLNLSNKNNVKLNNHLISPILTQCLNNTNGIQGTINSNLEASQHLQGLNIQNIKKELLPNNNLINNNNSLKSLQNMKINLIDNMKSNHLIETSNNINNMLENNYKHEERCSTKSPKISSNSTSPINNYFNKYQQRDEDLNENQNNINKRKYDNFINDQYGINNKEQNHILDIYKKEININNNNNEIYKNYEQFILNNKREQLQSDQKEHNLKQNNKLEVKRDIFINSKIENKQENVNNYFKNYLENMVKVQQQKLPTNSQILTPNGQHDQLKFAAQQLWLQQIALNQLAANSMNQLPNSLQHQQTVAALQQQQLLYERQLLNSRLNQQAVAAATGGVHNEEKLYSWTNQLHANQRELEEKLKLLIQTQQQIMNDKNNSNHDSPTSHSNHHLPSELERIKKLRTSMNVRDILECKRQQSLEEREEEMRKENRMEEDIEDNHINQTLDLTSSESPKHILESPENDRFTPINHIESPIHNVNNYLINHSENESNHSSIHENNSKHLEDSTEERERNENEEEENNLESAIIHGEQFLFNLEKISHPKLTLQHLKQIKDLLYKLKTPIEINNCDENIKENNLSSRGQDEVCNKSKRKSILNIVHKLQN